MILMLALLWCEQESTRQIRVDEVPDRGGGEGRGKDLIFTPCSEHCSRGLTHLGPFSLPTNPENCTVLSPFVNEIQNGIVTQECSAGEESQALLPQPWGFPRKFFLLLLRYLSPWNCSSGAGFYHLRHPHLNPGLSLAPTLLSHPKFFRQLWPAPSSSSVFFQLAYLFGHSQFESTHYSAYSLLNAFQFSHMPLKICYETHVNFRNWENLEKKKKNPHP